MKFARFIKFSIVAFALAIFGAGSAYAAIHIGGGNDTTGPYSENENEWEIDHDMDIHVDNYADADNEYEVEVVTGDNDIDHNTEVDDIYTGDIDGDIYFENYLNDMEIELEPAEFGDIWIDFENDTTGPQSENENEIKISMDQDIHIRNSADFDNDIDLDANTGNNDIDHNTIVGDVRTGDIDFSAHVKNMANGSYDLDMNGASFGSDIDVDLGNTITGPNSENENKVRIEGDSDISLCNRVDIDNELEVEANTGKNDVGNNTVVGDIRTGSISIDFHAYNSAN